MLQLLAMQSHRFDAFELKSFELTHVRAHSVLRPLGTERAIPAVLGGVAQKSMPMSLGVKLLRSDRTRRILRYLIGTGPTCEQTVQGTAAELANGGCGCEHVCGKPELSTCTVRHVCRSETCTARHASGRHSCTVRHVDCAVAAEIVCDVGTLDVTA